MKKIDFFGGTHGNFLELVLNVFVDRHPVQFAHSAFTPNGSCHLKNQNPEYQPTIKCGHWSFFNLPLNDDDQVIQIHVDSDHMLIALTNSLVRAGDRTIELNDIEINTIEKLSQLPKAQSLLSDLVHDHGTMVNYPRSALRNYFYAKFSEPAYGVDLFNNFKSVNSAHVFPFKAFFNIEQFYLELNRCAFFLNSDFYPDYNCSQLWHNFIQVNQGYQSQRKCNRVVDAILMHEARAIPKLNVVEEAWINYRIAQIYRCYDHELLISDVYPSDTRDIFEALSAWKNTQ